MKNFLIGGFLIGTLSVFVIAIIELIVKFSTMFGEYGFYIYVFILMSIIGGLAYSSDPENKYKF